MVVDASVAVRRLLPEPGSKAAAAYLAERPIASPMSRLGRANAVIGRLRRGEIVRDEAAVLLAEVEFLPVKLRPVQERAVFDLALALRHPDHDCAYLVIARTERVRMVTADERFFRAAQAAGLSAHTRLLPKDQP